MPADLGGNFAFFFLAYLVAVAFGFLSHAPGGIGVFEAALVTELGASGRSDLLAALVGICRKLCRLTGLGFVADRLAMKQTRLGELVMISFKGAQFPKYVILFAVFFYVRYTVSYRDLEEILAERGVRVDHATLNRWVAKYSPLIANTARRRKTPTDRSWRMDETYIKVRGEWVYLYRAVDRLGKTLDFMLSKRRNKTAATKFFARALEVNGLPSKVVIDRSGANTAGISAVNRMLRSFGCPIPIEMVRIKYLNDIVEQDHRTVKKRIRPMLGFKSFVSASATLEGIEVANMIRKGQFTPGLWPFAQFAALAA